MACILDGTYTFENAGQYLDSSIPNVNYSNYSVTFNEQELIYLGGDAEEGYLFAVGGTIGDIIFPSVTIWPEYGITAFTALGNPYNGEATVSICEKESDDSCPDAPFSESAPEKYADYFDEDGNFVPKASSDGGDCAFDIINVNIIDETENVYAGDAVKIAHLISAPLSGIVSEISGGDEELQAISYNGKALLVNTGVANITVNPISNAQPAGTPGYLYITGDVSITIKDSGGIA